MFTAVTPHLGPAGLAATGAVVLLLLISVVRATPARMARLRALALAHPAGAAWVYRRSLAYIGTLAVLALVPLLEPGVDAADLGLAGLADYRLAVAAGILAALGGVLYWRHRRVEIPADAKVAHLLPRTRRDRRWAVLVAAIVGIGEEIVFRGTLLAAGVGVLGLNPWSAAFLSAVLFAAGHRYQGRAGVLSSFGFAFFATLLYAATGNLLAAMAVHIAVDLASLLGPRLVPAAPPAAEEGAPRPSPVPLRPAAPDAGTAG
ncbi:CPBP family intramembrane glutamic endopeptidase [Dactylosporangium salmoneum]|uniref:CAAX prenyl protease 2/Lysostaphin resistance protein A-like domain-containing protein n=1 Tax=Dactylosporangium salmoneum TaxID=53361 RepID=A0ABN3GJ46_9ACTN